MPPTPNKVCFVPPSLPTNPSEIAASGEPHAEPVPGLFVNRDLSWLEFNLRVLHEAEDDRTPLLERVRFLGIFPSNLDEF